MTRYRYADIFHCEPIEKVADDFIQRNHILTGSFDNIASCKYTVPDYWDIGEVFERLIEDIFEVNNVIEARYLIYSVYEYVSLIEYIKKI